MDGERGPEPGLPDDATPRPESTRAPVVYVWKSPRPNDPAGADDLLAELPEGWEAAARMATVARVAPAADVDGATVAGAGTRGAGAPRAGAAGVGAETRGAEATGAGGDDTPFGLAPIDFVPFVASDDVAWFYRELTGDTPPLWNPDAPPKHGPPPNHLVVVPIPPDAIRETMEEVYSLALKYDLIVYDPQRSDLREPLAEMSAYASATFWPRGAIQAATAGGVGAVIAVVAWFVGIPIVSGIAVIVGAFLFGMAVLTFVAESRKRLRGEPGGSADTKA